MALYQNGHFSYAASTYTSSSSSASNFPLEGIKFISTNDVFSEKIFLESHFPLVLGRTSEPEQGVSPHTPYFTALTVSRKHAEMIWDSTLKTLLLRDVGSSSGTFVRGNRLSPPGAVSEFVPIPNATIIQLGQAITQNGVTEPCVKFIVQMESALGEDADITLQPERNKIIIRSMDDTVVPNRSSPASTADIETTYTQSTQSSSEEGSGSGKFSPVMHRSQRIHSFGATGTLKPSSQAAVAAAAASSTGVRYSLSESILNSLISQNSFFQSSITGAILEQANSVSFFQSNEPGSSIIARHSNGDILIAPTKDSPLKMLSSLFFSAQDKREDTVPRKLSGGESSSTSITKKLKDVMRRTSALGLKKSVSKEELEVTAEPTLYEEGGEEMISVPSILQLNFSDVFLDMEIHSSQFSTLYKAALVKLMPVHQQRLLGSKNVWVKTLNDEVPEETFKRELAILWSVNLHTNCCTMVGYSELPPSIVYKSYSGTLTEVIQARQFQFSPKHLFMVALDISQGIACLHSLELIHMNITSDNIYLQIEGTNCKAALGEFGVTQPQGDICSFNPILLHRLNESLSFVAPEVLQVVTKKADLVLKSKLDVYSYSMVLYHLLTRELPWHGLANNVIIENVVANKRPTIPPHIQTLKDVWTPILLDLMLFTWDEDPLQRPSAIAISSKLNTLIEKLS